MSIITLLIVLAVVGVLTWAITTYVPMDLAFKRLIVVVAVVASVLWCLSALGLLGPTLILPRGDR